jgi:hypothetical protein
MKTKFMVADQINLFPTDAGLVLRAYSLSDADTEITSFVIPWHEVGSLIDRMGHVETSHVDVLAGISPF